MQLIGKEKKLRLAKKILGNKGMNHVSQILDHSRFFRLHNESGRIPLFLFYYFYKVLMNSLIPNKKIVNINGYKMKLIPNDEGISRELLIFKSHEPIAFESAHDQPPGSGPPRLACEIDGDASNSEREMTSRKRTIRDPPVSAERARAAITVSRCLKTSRRELSSSSNSNAVGSADRAASLRGDSDSKTSF